MVIKPVVNVKMLSFNHKSAKKVLQLQITAVFVFLKCSHSPCNPEQSLPTKVNYPHMFL